MFLKFRISLFLLILSFLCIPCVFIGIYGLFYFDLTLSGKIISTCVIIGLFFCLTYVFRKAILVSDNAIIFRRTFRKIIIEREKIKDIKIFLASKYYNKTIRQVVEAHGLLIEIQNDVPIRIRNIEDLYQYKTLVQLMKKFKDNNILEKYNIKSFNNNYYIKFLVSLFYIGLCLLGCIFIYIFLFRFFCIKREVVFLLVSLVFFVSIWIFWKISETKVFPKIIFNEKNR